MAGQAATSELLDPARDLGIDTCGRIAEFWGFTRTMGRAYGVLYFSAEPLSQSQIQSRLRISAGSASMTLAALGRWGVAHRVWVPGQRREHYQAETDFWKMISGVLNERERREIGAAVEVLAKARAAVEASTAQSGVGKSGVGKSGVGKSAVGSTTKSGVGRNARAEAAFLAERLARLHDICQLGQTMLDMLLGQLKLDVGQFRDVLRVAPAALSPTEAAPPSKKRVRPSPAAHTANPARSVPRPRSARNAKSPAATRTRR